MSNVYLDNLRAKYKGLEDSITTMQTRAVEAGRDLTDEEKRSIVQMSEQATVLHTEITTLSEVELRNAQNRQMAAQVDAAMNGSANSDSAKPDDKTEFRALGITTQDRDPGIYTRGGEHSFLADQFRSARMNDKAAKERLT